LFDEKLHFEVVGDVERHKKTLPISLEMLDKGKMRRIFLGNHRIIIIIIKKLKSIRHFRTGSWQRGQGCVPPLPRKGSITGPGHR